MIRTDGKFVLPWLADFTGRAGTIPPVTAPPRPELNQPYPAVP